MTMENLQRFDYFVSSVYQIDKPEFLETVKEVSEEYLDLTKKEKKELDEIYPCVMSHSFFDDERVKDFATFIGDMAWQILQSQGYQMGNKLTYFTEMWTQEHHKHSSMEQHAHGRGAQIVGFYFLEVPENSSKAIFHDPRQGKVLTNLEEADVNMATSASIAVNFTPTEGSFIFTNASLPHSFTRHANEKPLKFVHFNVCVADATADNCSTSQAEVI